MKLLAFLGSPRKNGNSARLLDEFLKGVSRNNCITINKIYLQERKISGCSACGYCLTNSTCIIRDGMQIIYPIIKESDTIVFSTPIFWWSIPSQLKALIDRFYALKRNEIKNKKIYLLMTYGGALPNSGYNLVEMMFKEIFEYVGCELVKVYGVCTDDYMPVKQNTKALKEIFNLGKNV
jgi:multimeric flavodoxin WrbA